jgi:hypothetical protein
MALTLGTVSVDEDGTVTKSHMAGRLFDELEAMAVLASAPFGQVPASGPDGAPRLKGNAMLANALSTWIYTELTAHAEAHISAGAAGDGLQITPDPNDPLTATKRPLVDKYLPIV